MVSRSYPNGIIQTNVFDTAGRITGLQYQGSGSNSFLIALTYAYDRNGNKIGSTEKGTLNWPAPSMHNETAQYTPAGRLVNKVDAGVASNNFIYAYDSTGNMTNALGVGQSFAFSYDEDNRVLGLNWEIFPLTSKVISNRYDAFGRRISCNVNGTETRYALDLSGNMERILCDMDGNSQITAYYIHGPDLCYKVDTAGNLTCYHSDAQGNIIALTGIGGTNTALYAYTPYGRSLGSTNLQSQITNPYLFVGSQGVMEENGIPGLYFMRARYYSADTGAFLSTDPMKHIGPTWHPVAYVYGIDNPLAGTDPTGRSFMSFVSNLGKSVANNLLSAVKSLTSTAQKAATSVANTAVKAATSVARSNIQMTVAAINEAQAVNNNMNLTFGGLTVSDFNVGKYAGPKLTISQSHVLGLPSLAYTSGTMKYSVDDGDNFFSTPEVSLALSSLNKSFGDFTVTGSAGIGLSLPISVSEEYNPDADIWIRSIAVNYGLGSVSLTHNLSGYIPMMQQYQLQQQLQGENSGNYQVY